MKDILPLYRNIDKIKHHERQGWVDAGVKGTKDTIASHSFGATILGWILSQTEDVDENKVMKLLIIHDLIMAHIPDVTPKDASYKKKKDLENSAGEKLLQSVPDCIKEEFAQCFKEYQEGKTEEAKIAREADKLDTVFQAIMYSERLHKNEVAQFLNAYESTFQSRTSRKIVDEIKKKWL
jgi:putative hydrolase of HD superfamily